MKGNLDEDGGHRDLTLDQEIIKTLIIVRYWRVCNALKVQAQVITMVDCGSVRATKFWKYLQDQELNVERHSVIKI